MEERREGEGRLSSDLALAFDDVGAAAAAAAEGPAEGWEGWEGEERRGEGRTAVQWSHVPPNCCSPSLPQITHSFCPSNFPKGHFTCLTLNVSSHYYSNSFV